MRPHGRIFRDNRHAALSPHHFGRNPMSTKLTPRNVSLAGVLVSIALAVVIYRMNTGTGGDNHGPAWCIFGAVLLEIALWQYLFYCVTRECPGPGKEGHEACVNRCFLRFIILQLILIILLLLCLLITGPKW
jgi:hypothetical protein